MSLRLGALPLLLAAVLAGAGCSLVDKQLPSRTHDINQGTQNVRESAILLNVVRASRSEPLNFVALSKYTGSGSLSSSDSALRNNITRLNNSSAVAIAGSVSGAAAASASNSFDVGTLENREFYGGLLTPINLEGLNLLLNAGLNREIIFHSVFQAFRVTLMDNRAYLFENNPEDDSIVEKGPWSAECRERYGTDEAIGPIAQHREVWGNPGMCRYQKFLYFLRLAVRWGVTVGAAPIRPEGLKPAGSKGRAKDRGDEDDKPRTHYYICFDPAIARENGLPATASSPAACGSDRPIKIRDFLFRFSVEPPVKSVLPIIRSPYAVFQYYGNLLAREEAFKVQLSRYSLEKDRHRERRLFTVKRDDLDCFASVYYGGQYCVPNDHAKNTKEVFVVLNTLVALSTNRSALPVSPTFILSQ